MISYFIRKFPTAHLYFCWWILKRLPKSAFTYYQQVIHATRYSRWDYDKKKRESWEETVDRFMRYMRKTLERRCNYQITPRMYKRLRRAILNQEVMPSMRLMMTAGIAADRDQMSTYNCSYTIVNYVKVFPEAMYILMSGTGLGYSVRKRYVNMLPTISNSMEFSSDKLPKHRRSHIVVDDCRIGWCKAFEQLLDSLYTGVIPTIDYTQIRPKGSVLKTFGGRASGPKVLIELFQYTIEMFKKAKGRKLSTLECHLLMCKVAAIVIAGGVRRSALICLFDEDDEDILNCKHSESGDIPSHLHYANNSIHFNSRPSWAVFSKLWDRLVTSKSGEPGIFNHECAVRRAMSAGRALDGKYLGTNPCLRSESMVLTKDRGILALKFLMTGERIWSKHGWTYVVNKTSKGRENTSHYETNHGEFWGTPNHPVSSGGSMHEIRNVTHVDILLGAPLTEEELIKANSMEHMFSLGDTLDYRTVAGMCESGRPERYAFLKQVAEKTQYSFGSDRATARAVQRLASSIGIALKGNFYVDGQRNMEGLILSSAEADTVTKIEGITELGQERVYDITVANQTNTFWADGLDVYNCGEISLLPFECCNLSEMIVRHWDTEATLLEKAELATFLGTYQSTLTNFRYVRDEWKETCEKERLLGVSMTGIFDNPLTYDIEDPMLPELLARLRMRVQQYNVRLAKEFGINPSVARTTIKPSGTVSQLCDTASGIHPRHAKYYIRRVRGSISDPAYKFLKEAGIPSEPASRDPETVVLSFPIKSPEGAMTRKKVNAKYQLELWKIYSEYYSDHQVSCTINVRDEEWKDTGKWVYDNFDEITGLSFFPFVENDTIYEQPPNEEVDEKTYNELVKKMPRKLDWSKLSEYEQDDYTTGSREYACTGDQCSIF